MDRETEFRDFVHGASRRLLRTSYLLTGDRPAADDLLQTTFAKAWFAWSRVSAADDPEAYVRRILVNAYAASWRRRWRGEQPTAHPPERAGPDATTAFDERDEMWQALRALPRRQRAVIVLRYYEDLTEAETAGVLEISVGTVKSQTAKALAKLRTSPSLTNGGPR